MAIKKFSLCKDEWAPDTGELTPTLKLKREFIMEKYKGKYDYIYGYSDKEYFLS